MKESSKILIVDDVNSHLLLLETILEGEGYVITLMSDPLDVQKELKKNSYDAMILDLMMPNLSGMELLKLLRKDEVSKDLPILIVSAKSDYNSIRKSLEYGATDYVVKPVNINDLKNKLKAALK